MMRHYKKAYGIKCVVILYCFFVCSLSDGLADEKRKYEPIVHGVMIVSMDLPLLETIGNKVNVEINWQRENGKSDNNSDSNLPYHEAAYRTRCTHVG